MSLLRPFPILPTELQTPRLFTNPFDYQPSEIVRIATQELMAYIESREEWHDELSMGKMFGVLVCKSQEGELGYLSAFSGNLDGRTIHSAFVPPIFDLHSVGSFFRAEERHISAINNQIKEIENDPTYISIKRELEQTNENYRLKIADYKQFMSTSKAQRDKLRATTPSDDIIKQITKESQFQKAELRRIDAQYRSIISKLESTKSEFIDKITQLKNLRQNLSKDLQHKIFENYIVRNHLGEQKTMIDIFEESRATLPPSGAGECAAPKLLHYAFSNNLIPIAMGEFWWGDSPRGEVRHHGEFYAACKSKCEPILGYMLRGMELDLNDSNYSISRDLRVVYCDDWIAIVDKPAGMLSVKGRVDCISVEGMLPEIFTQYPDAKVVHRLDMDTSGILIVALDSKAHSLMQQQFENREVHKEYLALLDGVITNNAGEIDLPISADYEQRPRQRINYFDGKEAHTSYKVLSTDDNKTKISLTPHTGRTHQLRLHCAHKDGLGRAIIGDRLYGHPSSRLMLQAYKISFSHPITHQPISIEIEPEF